MRKPKQIRIAYCQRPDCGKQIPPEKLAKSPRMKYCSRECDIEMRKRSGLYKRAGAIGNQVQAQIKHKTGKIPQYEKRVKAARLNLEKAHQARRSSDREESEESTRKIRDTSD